MHYAYPTHLLSHHKMTVFLSIFTHIEKNTHKSASAHLLQTSTQLPSLCHSVFIPPTPHTALTSTMTVTPTTQYPFHTVTTYTSFPPSPAPRTLLSVHHLQHRNFLSVLHKLLVFNPVYPYSTSHPVSQNTHQASRHLASYACLLQVEELYLPSYCRKVLPTPTFGLAGNTLFYCNDDLCSKMFYREHASAQSKPKLADMWQSWGPKKPIPQFSKKYGGQLAWEGKKVTS